MKRILLLILMLIFFITPGTLAASGNVYENQQYKFRMTFPDDWQINTQKASTVEAHSQKALPVLAVICDSKSTHKASDTQEDEISLFIQHIQKDYPTMELVDKRHFIISNHAAVRIRLKNDEKYFTAYFILNNDYYFLISAIGYSDYMDVDQVTFNDIISTLEFIE